MMGGDFFYRIYIMGGGYAIGAVVTVGIILMPEGLLPGFGMVRANAPIVSGLAAASLAPSGEDQVCIGLKGMAGSMGTIMARGVVSE